MLIGGVNSLEKVSLYNWETKQQCELGAAPFFGYGISGMSLNDVPLVCGVYQIPFFTRNLCYKYDRYLNKWSPVS